MNWSVIVPLPADDDHPPVGEQRRLVGASGEPHRPARLSMPDAGSHVAVRRGPK